MRKAKLLPTQERLNELFTYSPVTGELWWKKPYNSMQRTDSPISNPNSFGYLRVSVDGHRYKVHRVIWKMVTGQEPPQELDHIDRNRSNNAWHNLRPIDRQGNCLNASHVLQARGYWKQSDGRFCVGITRGGERLYAGSTFSEAEAIEMAKGLRSTYKRL